MKAESAQELHRLHTDALVTPLVGVVLHAEADSLIAYINNAVITDSHAISVLAQITHHMPGRS
jgi:hypothetical protein